MSAILLLTPSIVTLAWPPGLPEILKISVSPGARRSGGSRSKRSIVGAAIGMRTLAPVLLCRAERESQREDYQREEYRRREYLGDWMRVHEDIVGLPGCVVCASTRLKMIGLGRRRSERR
jgi:hypothetical protein